MIEEVGTEVPGSDATGAGKDLFGDEADYSSAVDQNIPEEEAHEEEVPQQEQGPGEAKEETGAQDDLKVVVAIRGDRAVIGVQRPSTDPYFESFDGRDLSALAQEVLAVIERARTRWENEPKHPAHTKPSAPAKRQTRQRQKPPQGSASGASTDQHQPEALRLF